MFAELAEQEKLKRQIERLEHESIDITDPEVLERYPAFKDPEFVQQVREQADQMKAHLKAKLEEIEQKPLNKE